MTLLARFIEAYPNLEYFSYQKNLNEQSFVVLTTSVFETKEEARLEIQQLPQAIIDRGVWIKALSIIKTEIEAID
jgi:DamX protein